MQSSLISRIEKAKLYSQEKDRITFFDLSAKFRGGSDTYTVTYHDGKWGCTCPFFASWDTCSHTMALEKILDPMLPEEAITTWFTSTV